MFTLLQQGGIIFYIILGVGVFAIVVFLERAFHIHRAKIKTEDFLKGVFNIVSRGNDQEALTICDETPGPVARVVHAAILHRTKNNEIIERAMNDTALTEISRMERRFSALATIAKISPLLGLLGTVIGIINTYIIIQQQAPLVYAGDLAAGIWQACLATAGGLSVAIFSYTGYNLLVNKVQAITLDVEKAVGETLGFFTGSGTLIVNDNTK
jgi:biopolymer transport protein ExbB